MKLPFLKISNISVAKVLKYLFKNVSGIDVVGLGSISCNFLEQIG